MQDLNRSVGKLMPAQFFFLVFTLFSYEFFFIFTLDDWLCWNCFAVWKIKAEKFRHTRQVFIILLLFLLCVFETTQQN